MDAVTLAMIKGLGGSGGSSLPSVSSSDNGKVLAVKDGAWAAGTPYVLVTQVNNVASLKGSEINSLAASGVEVLMKDSDGLFAYLSASGTTAVFTGVTSTEIKKITVTDNKLVSRTYRSVYSKPSGGIPETDLAQAVKDKLNKFVVTLTPTAADYSGTMDKTVAEITAAYEAGQELVFRFVIDQDAHADVAVTAVNYDAYTYPSFDAFAIMLSANVLVYAHTSYTNDGTRQTYSTKVYSLTPAS